MAKIFTVFGATGKQGGSVINAVLNHPELAKTYTLRAVTRDPTSPRSRELVERGIEVVRGDLDDLPTIVEAVRGSNVVFGVTNCEKKVFESEDGYVEFRQGAAIVVTSVAERVEYLIFSTLPNASIATNGALRHIAHFDSKAKIEAYARTQPIKSSFFWPAMYAQMLRDPNFGPRKQRDGTYIFACLWAPDSKIPVIDITADAGKHIIQLLKDPDHWNHKRLYGAGGFYTPTEMADILTKETGKTVRYLQVPDEDFKYLLPASLREELYEMFVFMRDWKYFGPEGRGAELEWAASQAALDEPVTTFEEFVRRHKWFQ